MKRPRDDQDAGIDEVVSSEEEMGEKVAKDTTSSSTWLGHCPMTPGPSKTALLKSLAQAALDKERDSNTGPKAIPAKAMPIIKSSAAVAMGKKMPKSICGGWGLPHLIPPGSRDQMVHVWPTGFKVLRHVYQQFVAHNKSGHGRFMPCPYDIVANVREFMDPKEAAVFDTCKMVIVDGRGPSEAKPAREDMLHEHCGTHPVILDQVLAHETFIASIGHQLHAQWPNDKGMAAEKADIGVVVFCQSGKHRSVAWAHLIQALVLSEGYNAKVHNTAMNPAAISHQAHCNGCLQVTPHGTLNKAIIGLSMVMPAPGPLPSPIQG